jgi:hypothetical protein
MNVGGNASSSARTVTLLCCPKKYSNRAAELYKEELGKRSRSDEPRYVPSS